MTPAVGTLRTKEGAEANQFSQRRHTSNAVGQSNNGAFGKRSISVDQTEPRDFNAEMARTAPQGFFKAQ